MKKRLIILLATLLIVFSGLISISAEEVGIEKVEPNASALNTESPLGYSPFTAEPTGHEGEVKMVLYGVRTVKSWKDVDYDAGCKGYLAKEDVERKVNDGERLFWDSLMRNSLLYSWNFDVPQQLTYLGFDVDYARKPDYAVSTYYRAELYLKVDGTDIALTAGGSGYIPNIYCRLDSTSGKWKKEDGNSGDCGNLNYIDENGVKKGKIIKGKVFELWTGNSGSGGGRNATSLVDSRIITSEDRYKEVNEMNEPSGWRVGEPYSAKCGKEYQEPVYTEVYCYPIEYTIEYVIDGGTPVSPLKTSYTVLDEFDIPNAEKEGFIFLGWYDEQQNKVERIVKGTTGNKKFTAKYKASYSNIKIDDVYVNSQGLSVINKNGTKINPPYTISNIRYNSSDSNPIGLFSECSVVPGYGTNWTFNGYSLNPTILPTNKTENDANKLTNDLMFNKDGEAMNLPINGQYYYRNNKWVYENEHGATVTVYPKFFDEDYPSINLVYNPVLEKNGEKNYTNGDVTVKITVGDLASGLAKVQLMRIDGDVLTTKNYDTGVFTDTITYVADKNIKFEVWAFDRVGHISKETVDIDTIDKAAPNYALLNKDGTAIECGSTYDSDGTIEIRAQDTNSILYACSGIAKLEWQLRYVNEYGKTITTQIYSTNSNTIKVQMPVSGPVDLMIRVTDKAGNVTESALTDCQITFNKTHDSSIQLTDLSYVFKIYDKVNSASAFIDKLENDTNATAKNALKYIQNKIKNGSTESEAVRDFLNTYNYDLYKKNY